MVDALLREPPAGAKSAGRSPFLNPQVPGCFAKERAPVSGITRLPPAPLKLPAAASGAAESGGQRVLLRVIAADGRGLWLQLQGRLYRATETLPLRPGAVLAARMMEAAEGSRGREELTLRLESAAGSGRVLHLRPARKLPDVPAGSGRLAAPLRAVALPVAAEAEEPLPLRLLLDAARGLEPGAQRHEAPPKPGDSGAATTASAPAAEPAAAAARERDPEVALLLAREEAQRRDEGRRWWFEVELARLGRVRLELFARGRRRDLRLWSERPLPAEVRLEIADLFGAALEIAGLGGELAFARFGQPGAQPLARSGEGEGFLV